MTDLPTVVSSSDMQWQVLASQKPASTEELTEVLLANRNITDSQRFFNPLSPLELRIEDVGFDPRQMAIAVETILQAKDQAIVVFGDYDVDGISATTILCRLLQAAGCTNIIPFIPDRATHGYGLSGKAVDDLLQTFKPDLVITVDNGIVAHESVARVMHEGIQVIVTDHHAPEIDTKTGKEILPAGVAVVHTTQLCGATVAWMVGREIEKAALGSTEQAERALDLCGLATIADQVKLLDANRSFAWWGVKALQKTKRPAIKALCEIGKLDQKDLTVDTVNYVLAPRINAMGRLEKAQKAFDLLWTGSIDRAKQLASSVSDVNVKRQLLTQEMLDDARSQAKNWETEHLILVHSDSYHEGVIGLIAGKLVEEFNKPAIVLAVNQTFAKASARSILGVNIIELIREVRADLLEVGGHPGAAGFSVLPDKIPVIHEKLLVLAKQQISAEALVPKVVVECEIKPQLAEFPLVEEVVEAVQAFEPCGQGNRRPILGMTKMKVLDVNTMGQDHQHLKLIVAHQDSVQPIACLGWGRGRQSSKIRKNQLINIAGYLEINHWKQRRNVQLILKDVQLEVD